MTSSLNNFFRDTEEFVSQLQTSMKNNPNWYDTQIKTPFWQEKNKDFLPQLLGDLTKIYFHYNMIGNPNAEIQDDKFHKVTVELLSERLLHNIQNCHEVDEKLCAKLIDQLQKDNIHKILDNIPPSDSPSPRSR